MNVLAIGCHPDDIKISCCGTLAKCVKCGADYAEVFTQEYVWPKVVCRRLLP